MLCPTDQTPLTMSERQGIEIDYCPTCRGVWLDRGELDKIIERSTEHAETRGRDGQHQHQAPMPYAERGHAKPYYKRRKSFLEELFD